ncbi:unnamed protein product [Ilex paraguariensis]|uniref:Protein kinase domain-containing protein n=1 Tax=Ilex paraguariensis TaxID=185542 RepID=A0ABC8RVZ3_9AQUA
MKQITACSSMLSFKGSPYWMAPEVIMNTNGYSLAVDIWSLGCTILEMATSKPPWSQYEGGQYQNVHRTNDFLLCGNPQVAAIFKIGNSKEIPEIPDHLSNDAKNFIRLCLQREPSARPMAPQLLDHPFIRDLATTRVANSKITKEAFPYTFDGSHTPTASELHSNRTNVNTCNGDYVAKSVFTVSRTSISPSECPWQYMGYLRKIKVLLSSLKFRLTHVFRETNSVIDMLVDQAMVCMRSVDYSVDLRLPCEVASVLALLVEDQNGCQFCEDEGDYV